MKTYNNGLKKVIKRLPNEGIRSGWVAKVQATIKRKKLPEVSNSLLYAIVNDNTGLTASNMYLAEIIVQTTEELQVEYKKIKVMIEEAA